MSIYQANKNVVKYLSSLSGSSSKTFNSLFNVKLQFCRRGLYMRFHNKQFCTKVNNNPDTHKNPNTSYKENNQSSTNTDTKIDDLDFDIDNLDSIDKFAGHKKISLNIYNQTDKTEISTENENENTPQNNIDQTDQIDQTPLDNQNIKTTTPLQVSQNSQNTSLKINTTTQQINNKEQLEIFIPNHNLSKKENFQLFRDFLDKKDKYNKDYTNHKIIMAFTIVLLFFGLFSLWVPFYRAICETQGFSVKTHNVDYKFDNRKLNIMKKFKVEFIDEVDIELPWKFQALQKSLTVNAGETCLAFYRARNLTDEPIVGLSIYDIHPQSLALYFNKIQCFCFENQMLGPQEEVDLPVFFYIDPAINDNPKLDEYSEFTLKYTFYYAKKQDLAKVMVEHLKKEKEDREKLNNIKRELNKQGKNYKIEELDNKFTGLPGVNPELQEFLIQQVHGDDKTSSDRSDGENNSSGIVSSESGVIKGSFEKSA